MCYMFWYVYKHMVGDFWLYILCIWYVWYVICSRCFLFPGGEFCVPPRTPKHRFKICTVTADGLFNSLVFWVLCDFLSHQRASTGKVNQPFTDKCVRSILRIRNYRKLHIEDVTQQVSCVQTPVVCLEDVSICQLTQDLLFRAVGWSKIVSNQLKPFPPSYAGHRWLAFLGGCAGAGCCRPVTRAHHAICGCALHPGIFHHFDLSKDCPRCDIRKPMNLKISNIQGHILYTSKQTTSLQWNGVWGKLLKWHYLATWYHATTVAYDDAKILGHRVFFCVATRPSWSVFVFWYYVQVGVDSRRCCTASMATDSQGHPS